MQKFLQSNRLDFFILPSGDEFLSEYVRDEQNRLKILTGFTGSNGIAIFGHTNSVENFANNKLSSKPNYLSGVFLTDGRYTLQAQVQLGSIFHVYNLKDINLVKYITNNKTKIFGIDKRLISYSSFAMLCSFANVKYLDGELCDKYFNTTPKLPASKAKIFFNEQKVFGITSSQKIQNLVLHIKSLNADCIFIHDPHSICYLLNIRGNDIKHSPIINAFCIVNLDGKIHLFGNFEEQSLQTNHITISLHKISEIGQFITKDQKIILSRRVNSDIYIKIESIIGKQNIVECQNYLENIKAIKNSTEILNLKKACKLDSKTLNNFIKHIKKPSNYKNLNELSTSQVLHSFRSKRKKFIVESFPTISSINQNASIIHYNPETSDNIKSFQKGGLYLLDSGAHYKYGTTDITRVIVLGSKIKPEWKTFYTLVLKGHIAIANLVFPEGTTGSNIDLLARKSLWSLGLDYNHGTGHGIGYMLSVHEGPCSISQKSSYPIQKGMILSNEPGFYKDNEFGIRIENMLLVKRHKKYEGFLEFETITQVLLEEKLINKSMLTKDELKWVLRYQKSCK